MKNASCTSLDAVTVFLEVIGIWVDESLVNRLLHVQYFSLMADEYTGIATIEELSIFCRWEANGSPVEHFMEILPLNRCNAESMYSIPIERLKKKSIQCQKTVEMDCDGASTFAGKHSGIQGRLKKHAPQAIFGHCHCHKFQLAIVQAANSTDGIKHLYTTLTPLWKFFY